MFGWPDFPRITSVASTSSKFLAANPSARRPEFSELLRGTSSSLNAGGQGANTANQINPTVAILGGHDGSHPYFDGSAFANPGNGVLGTTGRNILRGPGLFSLNQSINRTFSFKEGKLKLQLVGEAFNLTNTVVFSNPQSTCCWVTNATTGAVNYNGFAVIGNTVSNPRYFQVGGYLRF